MRTLVTAALFAAVGLALPHGSPAQAQSAPVLKEQTPSQAEQSRAQDRSRAENVKIGRDWRAHGGDRAKVGRVDTERNHETIGRDWRAHPQGQDR
jgi:hypothetical protein